MDPEWTFEFCLEWLFNWVNLATEADPERDYASLNGTKLGFAWFDFRLSALLLLLMIYPRLWVVD